jgi:polyferredoxin
MKNKKRETVRLAALAATFILMCVLRLWYTLLIVFALGLILTLRSGKRNFCSDYCPMATLQDGMYAKKNKKKESLYRLLHSAWVKTAVGLLFWGVLITLIVLFYSRPSMLWSGLLSLMLANTVIAIILQKTISKRIWCATICPYGNLLGLIVTKRR